MFERSIRDRHRRSITMHIKKILIGSMVIVSMSIMVMGCGKSQPEKSVKNVEEAMPAKESQSVSASASGEASVEEVAADGGITGGEITFEDIKAMMIEDATKEQVEEAETLFNKANKLTKENKQEEADKVFAELYGKDYMGPTGAMDMSFDSFKGQLSKNITESQLKEAKELYEKAVELEKNGKMDEANKVWNELLSKEYAQVTESANQ